MPELPDLQVFSKNLNKEFAGKKLQELKILNKKKLKMPVAKLKKALEGSKLKQVVREGKEMHFHFDNDNVLGLHLMLRGKFSIYEKKNDQKSTVIELLFENGKGLAVSDYQGNATPTLNPIIKPSPDALSSAVNYKFLKEQLGKRKTTIKNLLMDQSIIRGIGNAYADEILWKAGIAPQSIANKIPDNKIRLLSKYIKTVLKSAEKQIIKQEPTLISGEIRDFLLIHNSKKKNSPTGGLIKHEMLNSRVTYYTDEQELYV